MTKLRLSEKQPNVLSKLLKNSDSYKSIWWVTLVAHEMDYKNHPRFTIIRRLVEENELPKVGQNDDQIEIIGETANRPQQITQKWRQ